MPEPLAPITPTGSAPALTPPDPAEAPRVDHRLLIAFTIGIVAFATLGVWAHVLATTTYFYAEMDSSLGVSMVSASQTVVTMLVMFPAGRVLDRFGPRRVLLIGAGFMTCASLLASWSTTQSAGVAQVGLLTSVALLSMGGSFYQPIVQATLPGLVRPESVAGLATIQYAAMNSAQIFGPLLGSWDLDVSTSTRFLANIVFFAPLALLALRFSKPEPGTPSRRTRLSACIRAIIADPYLKFAYLFAFTIGLLMEPPLTLGPALSASLRGDTELAGAIMTAFAVGSVVGGVRALGAGLKAASVAAWVAAAGYLIASLATSYAVIAVGLCISGAGFLWLGSALFAGAFGRIDAASRGQMLALWSIAMFSGRIFATSVGGLISDLGSPQVSLAAVAGAALLIGLLMRWRHRRLMIIEAGVEESGR